MDAELLKDIAFARGDHADSVARDAFGEFYQRHAAWLYGRLGRTGVFRLLRSIDAIRRHPRNLLSRLKGGAAFNPRISTTAAASRP